MGNKRLKTFEICQSAAQPTLATEDFVEGSEGEYSVETNSLPSSKDVDSQGSDDDGHNSHEEVDELDSKDEGLDDAQLDRHREAAGSMASKDSELDHREEEEELLAEPPQSSGRPSGEQKQTNSLATAFAEILEHPGPVNKREEAPILLGSKSLAKRQREEHTRTEAQKAAKKLRQEMKQRGHSAVPKKGENPEQDAVEKMLLKTATRGVVQLFNAVSKAQKKRQEALESGANEKGARINKSSFFSELRGQTSQQGKPLVGPGKEAETIKGQKAANDTQANGWDVLQDGFAGLKGDGRTKMKDWDKEDVGDTSGGEVVSGSESENEGDEIGAW